MNPFHVRTDVRLASGWHKVVIGITDHWEGHVRTRASTSGAKLYLTGASLFALPALRVVASVLEEDDFEVPEDRCACHDYIAPVAATTIPPLFSATTQQLLQVWQQHR